MPDASTSSNSIQYHHQAHVEPARHRVGTSVSQEKYVLTDRRDPDTVICLIVRRRVSKDMSVGELEALSTKMASEIEEDLRDIAQDYKVFG